MCRCIGIYNTYSTKKFCNGLISVKFGQMLEILPHENKNTPAVDDFLNSTYKISLKVL